MQVLHQEVIALRIVVRCRHTIIDALQLIARRGGQRWCRSGGWIRTGSAATKSSRRIGATRVI